MPAIVSSLLIHVSGRTGRIGHRGLATSFFTERDDPLASVLTRTLLETNQPIPEFLQHHVPEGEAKESLKFEADSDFEEYGEDAGGNAWGGSGNAGDGGSGDAWGGSAGDDAAPVADAWGGNTNAPDDGSAASSW